MKSHQAVMNVSRQLLLPLLPEGKEIDCIADRLGVKYDWLAKALHFPEGTKITGVSVSLRFWYDEISLRLESPDFIETEEGNCLPEVQALYDWDEKGNPTFAGWCWMAVERPSIAKEIGGPHWIRVRDEAIAAEAAKAVRFGEFL